MLIQRQCESSEVFDFVIISLLKISPNYVQTLTQIKIIKLKKSFGKLPPELTIKFTHSTSKQSAVS